MSSFKEIFLVSCITLTLYSINYVICTVLDDDYELDMNTYLS